MGDDVPLPVLANTPHMLYDYFKQRFAQVGALGRAGFVCVAVVVWAMMGVAAAVAAAHSKLCTCAASKQQAAICRCTVTEMPAWLLYCLLCRLQVTNPPIDPLREGLVMSLEMRLGGRGNLLQTGEGEQGSSK
jgi:hypothetical protein